MNTKRALLIAAGSSALLASAVGFGAMAGAHQGSSVLAQMTSDPAAAFTQRSPGPRPVGALFQTKAPKGAPPQAALPPPLAERPPASGLVPPVSEARNDLSCERMTTPASAVQAGPVSPEADRLAGQIVGAVQQALAQNPTADQAQRSDAVERGIETVLESSGATPEDARVALNVAQARLVALGVNCAPGVPQAMQVASTAVAQTPSQPAPGSIGRPYVPPLIGLPPLSGSGGGGGGVTHPAAS